MKVMIHFCKYLLGLEGAQTQTTAGERDCLKAYASKARVCVEIGVWHGYTTRLLRTGLGSDGRIFAIDPFPRGRLGFSAHRQIAKREVAKVSNGTVRWLRMTGQDAARWYFLNNTDPVDFLFVDGDHSWEGIEGDWSGWSPLVKVGGIVALHDSRSTEARPIDEAGTVRYTDAVISRDPRYALLDEVESLTVFRRIR